MYVKVSNILNKIVEFATMEVSITIIGGQRL